MRAESKGGDALLSTVQFSGLNLLNYHIVAQFVLELFDDDFNRF